MTMRDVLIDMLIGVQQRKKGGKGSGNFGHGGRPGKTGGSAPKASLGTVLAKIEDTTLQIRGEPGGRLPDGSYKAVASFGNINGAKAKQAKLGSDYAIARANGKYWVVERGKVGDSAKKPPPKPKPKQQARDPITTKPRSERTALELVDKQRYDVITGGTPAQRRTVREALSKIPESHISGTMFEGKVLPRLTEVKVVNRRDVNAELGRAASAGNRTVGFAVSRSGEITLAGKTSKKSLLDTTTHEVGHVVFLGKMNGSPAPHIKKAGIKLRDEWIDRNRKFGKGNWGNKTISNYSMKNDKEYQAESYSAFVNDNAKLQKKDPFAWGVLNEMWSKS